MSMGRIEEDILRSLRKITRSIDLHSRYLSNTFGLTGPQLICLRAINQGGEITPTQLAERVALSQATVTGIIDRLVFRQLVVRERSNEDRRVVTVCITHAGKKLIDEAPSPLQESFTEKLAALPTRQQEEIASTLSSVATMMGGEDIKAAPVLTTSPAALSAEEIVEVVDSSPGDVSPVGMSADQTPVIDDPSSDQS